MSLKRSKSRLAKTIGLDQKAKTTRSRSTARSDSEQLPSSDLKEDRGRLKITREGNEQRTFTPARDAERHEAVERAAAEHGLTTS